MHHAATMQAQRDAGCKLCYDLAQGRQIEDVAVLSIAPSVFVVLNAPTVNDMCDSFNIHSQEDPATEHPY